jgi:hypothetical protein
MYAATLEATVGSIPTVYAQEDPNKLVTNLNGIVAAPTFAYSSGTQIDSNNIVTQVLVIEQDVVDTGLFGDPASFIQTSYNTQGGVHKLGGTPLRKNYAGIGYTYDVNRDAFIPPKPFNSWVLNEDTCLYEAPTAMPTDDKKYSWDENTTSWVEITE